MNIFCDVIIPIYNAYDATVNCINSVIANTNLKQDRLILINDCSPDNRISEHINQIKLQNPSLNIIVVENEVNKGFVGTVNVGMKLSDNDVLLLNSDTIVGKDWLNKMRNCAYSEPKVGTVTALSNNATLASVPQGLMRNEVPTDITIDEYNDMLTKCAYREYPELPTAHGFCMYIRREVLSKLGFFDEKSFGRGYGEENDFSYRCIDYGYKNLLCDDVIVYHLESQSFSSEREKVIEKHLAILKEKYPSYCYNVDAWCRSYPLGHICKNIKYNLKLRNKKNVLLIIHEWDNTLGGTTVHVRDIMSSLINEMNFHVLFPTASGYILESHFGDEVLRTTMPFKIQQTSRYNRFNKEYGQMLDYIVRAYAIDSVHIHHMIGHYFDIAFVTQKYNINSIITLHDYYSLCPSITMLYCNKKYCGDLESKDCEKCLISTNRASNNIVKEWQADWHNFLKQIDTVIVPSEDTKERLQAVYSDIDITAIEHGVNNNKTDLSYSVDDKLRVAFIGVICLHKGGEIIRKLVKSNIDKDIEFHVFGKSEYPDLEQNTSNYIFHGPYERDNLSKLLWENKINVICFLQIWPETYSYTTNEAVSAGIPVISLDLGAGAERVKKYNLGWILPKGSNENDISKLLVKIKNNTEDYNRAVACVKDYNFKSVLEMSQEYKTIYNLSQSKTVDYEALRYIIKQESDLSGSFIVNNSDAQNMLNEILSSAKWRIVNKIRVPKIISRPLKSTFRLIKRILGR